MNEDGFPRLLRTVVFCALFGTISFPVGVAYAQTPQTLPVIIESDDARDGLYEAATQALASLHVQEGVPLAQATVPCGQGSTLSPYNCVNSTGFHNRYKDWITQHPGLFEIVQHGINHTEQLGTMTTSEQLDLINRGLQQMATWGLPSGRPFAFAPPFSSENASTISALQQLGFHTSILDSGDCLSSSSMDNFCESVALCANDASGNRVQGPACRLLSPSTVVQQVNDRQFDGKVFIVYHVQDVLLSDLRTVDPQKMSQMQAIFAALRSEDDAGHYRLMTFDTYYRTVRGVPTPTPLPGTDRVVYEDNLAVPWIDTSWSATVNYANTSPVARGTDSIRVAATGWGGWSVHSGAWGHTVAIDPSSFQSFDVQVYNAGTTAFPMAVRLENDAGNTFPLVVAGTLPANQWSSVSVSMSSLNPARLRFDRVDVFDNNGTTRTYYLDSVRFVGGGAATPTPRPTRTPPPPTATPIRTATAPPTATRTTSIPTATPPGPTPTPAAPNLAIFSDAVATPWMNTSWNSTVNFANTSPVFAGTRSIRVDETGWGALSLHRGSWTATQPIDPSRYQAVDFQAFAPATGFKVAVRLENDAKASFPLVVFGTIAANQWIHVTVPISQLDPSGIPFDRVDISDGNGTTRTYYVDELKLLAR
jgi:hypothetical protein